MKSTLFFLFFLPAFILSDSDSKNSVEIILNSSGIDKDQGFMFVQIGLKTSPSRQINLASQNYRLYYPSDKLRFMEDGSHSNLPKDKYGELHLTESVSDIDAGEVNQLEFDDRLGFVNFSIELKDLQNGGIYLRGADDWLYVATLKFQVKDPDQNLSVILSREGMSDKYATAFIELAEWIEPYSIESLQIGEYRDLFLKPNEELKDKAFDLHITVSPNPAREMIILNLSQVLMQDGRIIIKDMVGRKVKSISIQKGLSSYNLDVRDLHSASYILELQDDSNRQLLAEQIIVTR